MNLIFDIGNVLIHFHPDQFLHLLLNDPPLEEKMNRLIFKSDEWLLLDKGNLSQEEACEIFCQREPEHRDIIPDIMRRVPEMMTPIEETVELLPKIKAAGHRLYYLSNYHKEHSRTIQSKYSFFSLFDGGVFSCDVHLLKPCEGIYRHLLEKYALNPGDCVFFDDVEENVRAAERLGIRGVVFTGAQQAAPYIIDA